MWCGQKSGAWQCDRCDSKDLRTAVVGAARTAEEIGRAFPGIRVITSGKDHIVPEIDNEPALVIATPGAEPVVSDSKYQAIVILDPELSLGRADLRAEEESFFRWMRTLSMAAAGAPAVVAMPDTFPLMQLLIRMDPVGFALRELHNREEAQITPVYSTFEILLPHISVSEVQPPAGVRLLGPVPVDSETSRILAICNRADAPQVANWLKATVAKHSAAKIPGTIHVKRDPVPLH
jgi:primosomal protein N' (replication factor Y)